MEHIFTRYRDIFAAAAKPGKEKGKEKAAGFVIDLLSNRYYLQKDYAKSFMLHHTLSTLFANPNLILLTAIEDLYNKPTKNVFEQYLTENFKVGIFADKDRDKTSIPAYIKYMQGIVFLTNDKLAKAKEMFEAGGYSGQEISWEVFGYNRIECFDCEDNMQTDYLEQFPYIGQTMNGHALVAVERYSYLPYQYGGNGKCLSDESLCSCSARQ